jgi:hypothetical protein
MSKPPQEGAGAAATTAGRLQDRFGRLGGLQLQEYALAIVVVLLFVAGAILKPDSFPTWDNIRNMLTQASVVGVIAVGMTFVIATAGIDLSVGSMVALCGLAAAYVAKGGLESRFAVGQAADSGNPVVLAFLAARWSRRPGCSAASSSTRAGRPSCSSLARSRSRPSSGRSTRPRSPSGASSRSSPRWRCSRSAGGSPCS